ncbi:Pickpocket protein 28 [Eumeta japonica]|uniref:Pickpocket protein 28 n=1 Tax=Eumeta variegata TaxID=151549 RepID=A0A4C1VVS6_EUMVA|nr:Pickpocket protein 28 [Eumeta japonica]
MFAEIKKVLPQEGISIAKEFLPELVPDSLIVPGGDKFSYRGIGSSRLDSGNEFHHPVTPSSRRGKEVRLETLVFWLVTFLLSLGLCSVLICNVWIKWRESPVIVSFSEKMIPVWQVPFPSLTICPRIKTKTFVYNFTENFQEFQNGPLNKSYNTSRFLEKLDNVALVCGNNLQVRFTDRDFCDHTSVVDLIQKQNYSIWLGKDHHIQPLRHLREVVLLEISWALFCNSKWVVMIEYLDHGAMLRAKSLTIRATKTRKLKRTWKVGRDQRPPDGIIEDMVARESTKATLRTQPMIAIGFYGRNLEFGFFTGENNGITLRHLAGRPKESSIQKEYEYMYTTRPVQGWSPNKGYELKMDDDMYPRRGHQNSALPDLEIELLENVQKQDKLCIDDKRGFKIILHHPMDSPRAKPFYYIQGGQEGALSISFHMITTSEKLKSYAPHIRQCYFPAERKLRYFKEYTQKNCERECRANYTFAKCGCVWYNMAQELTIHEMKLALQAAAGNETKEGCDCLPACDSVKYEAELLKSPYSKTIIRQFNRSLSEFSEDFTQIQLQYEIAKLEVNFKDSQFSSLSRSELFGLTDFMANCGGLLGLFLGFSFLSIVEILYYFTLRLCCIVRRERKSCNMNKINDNTERGMPKDK